MKELLEHGINSTRYPVPCTPDANKEDVPQAFKEHDSDLRVLVATIAFGMGGDSRGVYRVIHFGPSKNIQETG